MTRLTLSLTLLLAVVGTPGGPAASGLVVPAAYAQDAVSDAPLLVQAHQSFVRVRGRSAEGTMTWTVAIVDPARAEGMPAPPELEGARARGAEITGGRLDLPDGLSKGTVLTFSGALRFERSPFRPSGTFTTVPGVPTARAELVVRNAGGPLSVWSDPTANTSWTEGRSPEARIVWRDVDPDAQGEAVWTATPDWQVAADDLERVVEPMLTDKLGRVLGRDLEVITPAQIAKRVYQEIRLVETDTPGWSGRPARYAIEDNAGTRAERGAVLLSVLRAAGYRAQPGLYRPSDMSGALPTALAVPELLPRPVIAVPRGDRVEWIDPAVDTVVPPDLPVELTGAVAWRIDDLPRRLSSTGAAEGTVSITGAVRLEQNGGESFNLTLTATGTAEEWLRDALGGQDERIRTDSFRALLTRGRPDLDRLTVNATGVQGTARDLRITVSGHASSRLESVSSGLVRESMPPLLATELAGWMPPRIAVREEVAITPPPGLRLFTTVDARAPTHPGAIVASQLRRDSDKIVITTDVERPRRHLLPQAAQDALSSLDEASRQGPQLLYVQSPTPRIARAVGSANLDAAERATLQAMLWWRLTRYRKARKLLERMLEPVGLRALDEALVRYDAPYELRRTLADLPTSDADKIASIPILLEQGRREDAWIRAAEVAPTRVHGLRVDSRLWMLELQPEARPTNDEEAAARWQEPEELLEEADAAGRLANDGTSDPRVLAAKAARARAAGRHDEAVALLQTAVTLSDDPELAVALAGASAAAGAPLDDVRERLIDAVSRSPSDPDLLARVSDAYSAAGREQEALEHALAAARIGQRDEALWSMTTERALAAGQLSIAVYAARRASDLALSDTEAASRLTRIATLAGDEEAASLGWSRGGDPVDVEWPPPLDALIGLVESPHLLALLRHHDTAVIQDAGLLSLRAQLELAEGERDRAVRDGVLLSEKHGIARGEVVAFGAALGQAWSSQDRQRLDQLAARDPAARAMRVELHALFGAGRTEQRVLAADLRAMSDEPRGKLWLQLRDDPAAFSARDEAWTPGRPPRGSAPPGFATNPILGAVDGVNAWSSSAARRAVVRHTGPEPLPPPLSVLYSLSTPPLRSLPGEGRVYLLEDGSFPVYAAVRQEGPEWLVGLGTSPEDAVRALEATPR